MSTTNGKKDRNKSTRKIKREGSRTGGEQKNKKVKFELKLNTKEELIDKGKEGGKNSEEQIKLKKTKKSRIGQKEGAGKKKNKDTGIKKQNRKKLDKNLEGKNSFLKSLKKEEDHLEKKIPANQEEEPNKSNIKEESSSTRRKSKFIKSFKLVENKQTEIISTLSKMGLQNLTPDQRRVFQNLHVAISENDRELKLLNEYRLKLKTVEEQYVLSTKHCKAVTTVGHMVGEVLKKLTDEKFIVKTSQGPRYVVGAKKRIPREKLVTGTRVALDITTLTIMKVLNREIDPTIFAMTEENPGDVDFQKIGGLADQVRQLKEIITLPLDTPEIFSRVGIQEPKGVLLYGPPGTGKTLLARAIAATMDVTFLKVVASSLIEKYIGESSRMIREMFTYAREKTPCIIFIDEIDAIGSKRSAESSSSDREVQRTLMELLNQLDGFNKLEKVKVIMATNRPDILDPALLRPGRLDRKIEIPLPNDNGRKEILQIYTREMNKSADLDLNMLTALSDGLNGADLRHVCTEAGMTAIREDRDSVKQDDFVKAVRKIVANKKLETKLDYKKP